MRARRARLRRATLSGVVLCLLGTAALTGGAWGERSQYGNLIVALEGRFAPHTLPRDHPGPVFVHLNGRLETADGSLLPRVSRIEIGLAGPGVLSTQGLPRCTIAKLRNTDTQEAMRVCGRSLVGHGRLDAEVAVPNQPAFAVHSTVLAFNARLKGGRRAVLVHGWAIYPPTSVVVPFYVTHPHTHGIRAALVGYLPATLGPWPHFASFDLTFGRRYLFRGRQRSFLNASCPVPRRFTAGFLSFARASFTLTDGRRLSRDIVRSCHAR